MEGLKSTERFEQLRSTLRAWGRRKWWLDYLNWLPRIVTAALIPALLVAAVSRYKPLATNSEIGLLGLALIAAGVALTTVILIWQRPSLMDQARFADKQFQLQERLVTAVELEEGVISAAPGLQELQLEESLQVAAKVNSREALPVRINWRDWLVVIAVICIWIAAVFWENSQSAQLQNKRFIQKEIAAQTEQLESLADDVNNNPELSAAQREQLAQPIENAINQLGEGDLSQEEAVAELSEAEQELRELSQSASNNNQQEALRQAGESLRGAEAAESIAKNLNAGNPQEAAEAVGELADQLKPLSTTDQAALSEGLAEAAPALEAAYPELAGAFERSAQSLATGDDQAASEALTDAGEALRSIAEEQVVASQAAALADEIGEGRQAIAAVGRQEVEEGSGSNPATTIEDDSGSGGDNSLPGNDSSSAGSDIQSLSGSEGGGETAAAETIYVPGDLAGIDGVALELPNACAGDPEECGVLIDESPADFTNEGSVIPYHQVFQVYQKAANEALADDVIPLGLRDTVHDYFSSLER